MKSRLGIFGGAFDPVHQGHIQAARFALETLDLDAVRMIPCNCLLYTSDAADE